MNDDPTKLEAAAVLIEEWMEGLNTKYRDCPCCKRILYESFVEHQLHVELSAVVCKLRGVTKREKKSKENRIGG